LELNDEDVNPGNYNAIENIFVGISSSQERSTLQNRSPCKMQSTRVRLQNGNCFKAQPNRPLQRRENSNKIESKKRRRKSELATGQTYVQEDAYQVAVTAVKSHLSGRFRENGPPLSIEFDPLPPGAFDTPLGCSLFLSLSLSACVYSSLLYLFGLCCLFTRAYLEREYSSKLIWSSHLVLIVKCN
jgi:hypothetical protein